MVNQLLRTSRGRAPRPEEIASLQTNAKALHAWILANHAGGIASELGIQIQPVKFIEADSGAGSVSFLPPNVLVFQFEHITWGVDIPLDADFFLGFEGSIRTEAAEAFLSIAENCEVMRDLPNPGQMMIHHHKFPGGYVLVDEAELRAFLLLVNSAMT